MLPGYTVYDLTQPLTDASPAYDPNDFFNLQTTLDYEQCMTATKFRVQKITMPLGVGTHMDAAAHAHPGAKTIEQYPIQELFFPLCIVDCRDVCNTQELIINPKHIHNFEALYGTIPARSFVYLYTGWATYWTNAHTYCNQQPHGNMHIPTAHQDTINLLQKRSIAGLGIDTLSPDQAPAFYAHANLLDNGCIIVENLATPNKAIPNVGAHIGIIPLPITGATESPVRAIAFVHER